ncbi:DUF6891 domain-containing protein [Pyxidicoccus xibeiensis]|uniref:DUF6891 domain-containing protein n=1 Tax=Pyxidicoccus xibeiensis TaxID=2906759 RepID=UPI0020A74D8E|nr:NusA N-terminal domain-containing protein [Pyxidicoccus xibeiensis]MCP3141376.1 hypothetical protein [Pyxidicoccus xibeiensis]
MKAALREKAEVAVLGGYLSEKQVLASIRERAEHALGSDDAVEAILAYTRGLLERHGDEERHWKGPTVNDAITRAFEELNGKGIIALEDVGGALSDGWTEVTQAAKDSDPPARGATFFQGQDVERGVLGQGLMLAFGAFDEFFQLDDAASPAIAREVRDTLARHGLQTEWDGSVEQRIHIPPFPWRKRRATLPARKGRARGRKKAEPVPERIRCSQVLDAVVREEGVTREEAIAALEAHIREAALKHYGDWRKLEARYDAENDRVELFQDVLVVERHADTGPAPNETTPAELGPDLGTKVEPGDELVFQLFYLAEHWAEAREQDAQYGHIMNLVAFERSIEPMTAQSMKAGMLEQLRAAKQ